MIVAALALLTSVVAIVVSVVSMYLQRQHNYKSLTPIPTISIGDYEDNIFVSLENTGIGPLIIMSIRVTDGNETKNDIISCLPDLPDGVIWDTFHVNLDGVCVPAGGAIELMKLSGDPDDLRFAEARDNCRKVLQRLSVTVAVKDIYQRTIPPTERSLFWFGRHFV